MLISGATARTLGFIRFTLVPDPVSAEERPTPSFVYQGRFDVQPWSASRLHNTLLASVYTQVFDVFVERGGIDLRRQDRTMIDDAECIVESVNDWGDHMELQVGARQ